MPCVMRMQVAEDFDLAATVCSYGFFVLAPNRWEPPTARRSGRLRTIVRGGSGQLIELSVTQPGGRGGGLRVTCEGVGDRADHDVIRAAVRRMLRLDEDLSAWRAMHPEAAGWGFGRVFRSASAFDDIVRTITGCNIGWAQAVRMNRLLCEHVGGGACPTAEQLAACSETFLRERCRTGYRARWLIGLGRDVAEGRLEPAELESPERDAGGLYAQLRQIAGVGDYAACNVLQLLGHYERLPADTELVRHMQQRYGASGTVREIVRAAQRHYDRYAPYQFLAFWFELWSDYARRFGDPWHWAEGTGERVTR